MKRIILFLLAALIVNAASAKKVIHWITFIDTTDKYIDNMGIDHGVGEIDKNGRKV